jgi:hypothetical protein
MPTPQARFDVAVVDDELYAISGVNDKYTPAGYENPDSPTPSPPPSQEPTSTPETQQPDFALTWIIVAVVSGVVVGIGLFVYFKKRKKESGVKT